MQSSALTNPYEDPFPIRTPEKLYGRYEILRHIFRRLFRANPPQSLQIIGLVRFGKSSVLNVLKCLNDPDCSSYFEKEFGLAPELLNKFLVIHVDCAGLSIDETSTFWKLLDQQLTAAQSLTGRQNKTEPLGTISFEDFSRRLFTAKKSRFIFLLDGFERVLQYEQTDIFHNLRYLLEKGMGNIAYITATPQTLHHYYTERSNAKNMASLFSYFDPEPIYLGPLEREGTRRFIEEPSTENRVVFTEDDINFVLRTGGQHPDLTRILCKFLFDNYHLPLEHRASQRELYNQLKNHFAALYNVLKNELSSTQLDALIRRATYSNFRNIPENTQNELIKLGLLRRNLDNNHIYLFSEVLKDFLVEEQPAGTSIEMDHQQGIVQMEGEDATTPVSSGLKLWKRQRAVQVGNKLVHLTPNEWKLFMYLWQHANQTCTREELIADADLSPAALDITISRLRKKIPRFIITVHGQGYLFEGNTTVTVGSD